MDIFYKNTMRKACYARLSWHWTERTHLVIGIVPNKYTYRSKLKRMYTIYGRNWTENVVMLTFTRPIILAPKLYSCLPELAVEQTVDSTVIQDAMALDAMDAMWRHGNTVIASNARGNFPSPRNNPGRYG